MGKLIEIRFAPDMRKAILEGRKSCTSRSEKKGEVGDWFEVEGEKFKIKEIQYRTLGGVAVWNFKEEGFASPEAFRNRRKELHRGHYQGMKKVFVHWFGGWFE